MTAKLDLSFFKTMKTTPVVKRLEYKEGWKVEMVFPDTKHLFYNNKVSDEILRRNQKPLTDLQRTI